MSLYDRPLHNMNGAAPREACGDSVKQIGLAGRFAEVVETISLRAARDWYLIVIAIGIGIIDISFRYRVVSQTNVSRFARSLLLFRFALRAMGSSLISHRCRHR